MAENSKIEWTDHSFNPWIGCTKVSAGCANCYAETLMDKRMGKVQWGPQGTRVRTSAANWKKPVAWNKQSWVECIACGWRGNETETHCGPDTACPNCGESNPANLQATRQRVFCASLADVFEDRPDLVEWRRELMNLIIRTPRLDWLILTKRPENVNRMIEQATGFSEAGMWFHAAPHVWMGTSVENQETANKRIPELLKVPAKVRFLSCEPLLGPVDLRLPYAEFYTGERIHWVIVGGESGPNARPMHPDWARSLRDQCVEAGVAFFMKQMGGQHKPFPNIPGDLAIRNFPYA